MVLCQMCLDGSLVVDYGMCFALAFCPKNMFCFFGYRFSRQVVLLKTEHECVWRAYFCGYFAQRSGMLFEKIRHPACPGRSSHDAFTAGSFRTRRFLCMSGSPPALRRRLFSGVLCRPAQILLPGGLFVGAGGVLPPPRRGGGGAPAVNAGGLVRSAIGRRLCHSHALLATCNRTTDIAKCNDSLVTGPLPEAKTSGANPREK